MIAIIDYGVGNLFSLSSSLSFLGYDARITRDKKTIEESQKIILPGVGAFPDAMKKLQATGVIPALKQQVAFGKPLLGICLGMQLLFDESFEHGHSEGLKLIKGSVTSISDEFKQNNIKLKIPHMGWNSLNIVKKDNPLMVKSNNGDYVYFVHSFFANNCDEAIVATVNYEVALPGVVANKNVYGCQFHPEKSGEIGLRILKAFAEI